jgi:hypothetical protein
VVTLLLAHDPHKYDHAPKSAKSWLQPMLGFRHVGVADSF